MDPYRLGARVYIQVFLLLTIIVAVDSTTTRICQRKNAKGTDHVMFMPSSHPFVYVMYSEAERKDISNLRKAVRLIMNVLFNASYINFQYLDTVTYLYGKRPTVPENSPFHVHASKMYHFNIKFHLR